MARSFLCAIFVLMILTGTVGCGSDNPKSENTLPIANAGADQNAFIGALVTLDASASSDADNDPLTYHWTLISIPAGSVATLSNPGASTPTFTADVSGDFVMGLIVNDGVANSPQVSVTISSRAIIQTWASGGTQIDQTGVYGVQGVQDVANTPGARQGNYSWVDNSGNLWLFGGVYLNSGPPSDLFNDLWKYDLSTGEWTWMGGSKLTNQPGIYGTQGVSAATNLPGSRSGAVGWKDVDGNFWLFGGSGYDSVGTLGLLNDVWQYNVSTGEWTWMSGSNLANQTGLYGTQGIPDSANIPGARGTGAYWVDQTGNLWIFSGSGYDLNSSRGYLNDLWRYDVSTGHWTWMGGSQFGDEPANYGTKGVTDPSNIPGPRSSSFAWVDNNNDLWLFAGIGYDSAHNFHYLNDLWHYNTTTGQWTWISGSNLASQPGTYGTQGAVDSENIPGARWGSVTWVDTNDDLWLFGGYYENTSPLFFEFYSDFWRFDTSKNIWVWEYGFQSPNQAGIYGTINIVDESNFPGGRFGSFTWDKGNGRIWILGGAGLDSTGTAGNLNDLWRIDIP